MCVYVYVCVCVCVCACVSECMHECTSLVQEYFFKLFSSQSVHVGAWVFMYGRKVGGWACMFD